MIHLRVKDHGKPGRNSVHGLILLISQAHHTKNRRTHNGTANRRTAPRMDAVVAAAVEYWDLYTEPTKAAALEH